MSDHCRTCIAEFDDLVGLTTPEAFSVGLAAIALCEGCGATQVDPDGYCLGGCEGDYFSGAVHECRHCTPSRFCPFHFYAADIDG